MRSRKTWIGLALLTCVCLGGSTIPALADAGGAAAQYVVKLNSPDGAPLTGAAVEFRPASGQAVQAVPLTPDSAVLTNVSGTGTLAVTHPKYGTLTTTVVLPADAGAKTVVVVDVAPKEIAAKVLSPESAGGAQRASSAKADKKLLPSPAELGATLPAPGKGGVRAQPGGISPTLPVETGPTQRGGSDDCASAEAISGTGSFAFNNAAATTDGPDHAACNFFGQPGIARDVWFCWTSSCDGDVTVSTCGGTGVDTKIAIYDGCACPVDDARLLACVDDACSLQTAVTFSATNGNAYLIRLGVFPGAAGGSGTFSISGTNCGGGGGGGTCDADNCADADAITGDGTFNFDNSAATTDGPDHAACNFFGQPGITNDIWCCWTASCDGTVTVATCGGTSIDSKIAVYDGCACPVDDARLLACNDDTCGLQSQVQFTAVSGNTYLIRLGNFPGASGGTGTFTITCPGGGGGGGADNCGDAEAIAGQGNFAFDNSTATTDGVGDPLCLAFGTPDITNDVWFCWTSDCDGVVRVETCGLTGIDSKIAAYDGCACPPGPALACNDDTCGLQSRIEFVAVSGQSYLLRVGTFPGAAGGTGQIAISCQGPPPEPVCQEPPANCHGRNNADARNSNRFNFFSADDFTPAVNGAVSRICWWGTYFDGFGDCNGVAPDTFEVRYYNDVGNLPGGLIATFTEVGGTLLVNGPVPTGNLIAGFVPEYEYEGTHAGVPVAAGQCYWLEISNAISGCSWFWELGTGGNGRAVQDDPSAVPNGYGPEDVILTDLAFCLNLPLGNEASCAPPPPTNDLCENAIQIHDEGTFAFDNSQASSSGPDHAECNFFGLPGIDSDLWYLWESKCEGQVEIKTCGLTGVDTKIAVYSIGPPFDGTACLDTSLINNILACNDDGVNCGLQSRLTFIAEDNMKYLIRVGTFPGAPGGAGAFMITCFGPPPEAPCDLSGPNCHGRNNADARNSNRTNFFVADDFTPATQGAIAELCWWGTYFDGFGDCVGVGPDTFEVRYYLDAGNLPGGLIAFFSQVGGTLLVNGPVPTGNLIAGFVPEYEYSATHAPVGVTPGVCYWVEVSNAIPGCSWFWELGTGGNNRAVQDDPSAVPNGYGPEDVIPTDLAFCLNIPLGNDADCAPPPAGNDPCGNALAISGQGVFPFDNSAATTDGPAHAACNFFGQPGITNDVWFCWTSDCTGSITVQTCGQTGVDTKIAVYDGCACPVDDARLLACNDDACGLQTSVTFNAVDGNTYLIRVGTFPGASGGTGTFTITGAGCGGGGGVCDADNCADADAIAGQGVFSFNNSAATTDGPAHAACNFFGQPGITNDIWCCWTSDCDGLVTVDTCGQTAMDSKIAVYDGCACPVNDARLLACNDDSCGLQSSVSFNAVSGNTYLIRLGNFPGATGGSGTFTISGNCGGGGCADFSITAPTVVNGNTCGSGNDCALRASEEHIYEVTLPNAGLWTFETCGSTYDTWLFVGTTCCGAEVGSNDDSCGLQSSVTANLAAGTYFVAVEAFSNSGCGDYTLSISKQVTCPVDGAITAPGVANGNTCGGGNDCPLRASVEHVYEVTIPAAGTWVFETCGSAYDTFLFVGTSCCGGEIGGNDDACGLQSRVTAVLNPGTYYATIEAFSSGGCGAYTLNVFQQAPLRVRSNADNVSVTVSPGDTRSTTTSVAPFEMEVAVDSVVSLNAPAQADGRNFRAWSVNGVLQTQGQRSIDVTITGETTVEALYQLRRGLPPSDGYNRPQNQ